jgi:hypothetical protein
VDYIHRTLVSAICSQNCVNAYLRTDYIDLTILVRHIEKTYEQLLAKSTTLYTHLNPVFLDCNMLSDDSLLMAACIDWFHPFPAIFSQIPPVFAPCTAVKRSTLLLFLCGVVDLC